MSLQSRHSLPLRSYRVFFNFLENCIQFLSKCFGNVRRREAERPAIWTEVAERKVRTARMFAAKLQHYYGRIKCNKMFWCTCSWRTLHTASISMFVLRFRLFLQQVSLHSLHAESSTTVVTLCYERQQGSAVSLVDKLSRAA